MQGFTRVEPAARYAKRSDRTSPAGLVDALPAASLGGGLPFDRRRSYNLTVKIYHGNYNDRGPNTQ